MYVFEFMYMYVCTYIHYFQYAFTGAIVARGSGGDLLRVRGCGAAWGADTTMYMYMFGIDRHVEIVCLR